MRFRARPVVFADVASDVVSQALDLAASRVAEARADGELATAHMVAAALERDAPALGHAAELCACAC